MNTRIVAAWISTGFASICLASAGIPASSAVGASANPSPGAPASSDSGALASAAAGVRITSGTEAPTGASVSASATARARALEMYRHLPLRFEANRGQADPAVGFVARQPGYALLVAPTEAVMAVRPSSARTELQSHSNRRAPLRTAAARGRGSSQPLPGTDPAPVVHMRFIDAGPEVSLEGMDRLASRSNYFLGNDPKRWVTGIENYGRVKARGVYSGVDVVYYGGSEGLEYDLLVAPGADPAQVRLAYTGVDRLRVDRGGDLVLRTPSGNLIQHKPVAYQEIGGRRRPVDARYTVTVHHGIREVGFQVASYDRTQPLVIDPTLDYSTFIGGGLVDEAHGIAVDANGNVYVTGFTASNGTTGNIFPFNKNLPTPQQWTDAAFVAQFIQTLPPPQVEYRLGYITFIGGNDPGDGTFGSAIAVDGSGDAFITGNTTSTHFPLVGNPVQSSLAGGSGDDAFVSELDSSGLLVYSTYLGGEGTDIGNGIAIDPSATASGGGIAGNVYVTGFTTSSQFLLANPLQGALNGPQDTFVAKIAIGQTPPVYSTYLGGSASETGNAIAVDAAGNAYVTGSTTSPDFPFAQNVYGGAGMSNTPAFGDAFVAKLNASGMLAYATYLGGSDDDAGFAIAVDGTGSAYIAGRTSSINFPAPAPALQTALPPGGAPPGFSAFVTKLNPSGNLSPAGGSVYSTYLGGNSCDWAYGIAVDAARNVYVLVDALSNDLPGHGQSFLGPPSANGDASCAGNDDFYLAKLDILGSPANPVASPVGFATYLGGVNPDQAFAIALDRNGSMYVAGVSGFTPGSMTGLCMETMGGTPVAHFPMVNASQSTPESCSDAVMARIGVTPTTVAMTSSLNTVPAGAPVTFTATVNGNAPTGGVRFKNGETLLSNMAASLTSTSAMTSTASFTTTALPLGVSEITALYTGDANNGSSSSDPFPQSVTFPQSSGGGGGGGCTTGREGNPIDPLLPLLLALACLQLLRRTRVSKRTMKCADRPTITYRE